MVGKRGGKGRRNRKGGRIKGEDGRRGNRKEGKKKMEGGEIEKQEL